LLNADESMVTTANALRRVELLPKTDGWSALARDGDEAINYVE